jgi:CelD/BcsL family acetyltransferase involved in cellulose biosynthesis
VNSPTQTSCEYSQEQETLSAAELNPAAVFLSPAYLSNYRRFFGAGKNFHRLQSRSENGTARVFLQTRGRTARRLEFWGNGIADVGGCEYSHDNGVKELWLELEALSLQHDGAILQQVDARSPLIELAQSSGWIIEEAEVCPVLELPGSWSDYVSSLGKNMREQIKRYPKRLEKQFQCEYSLAQTEDEVQRAMTDLFVLHGKRWRQRGQTGVLALPRRQKFHRAVASDFLKKGWLRLWSLHCDGAPACVLLSYVYRGRYHFFIGGFEPELMKWSVGTCLFARVFQTAIEEGAQEFDFLRGAEEYKYRFGAQDRHFKNLSWFAPTTRGKLLQKRVLAEQNFMRRLHEKFSAAHKDKH